MNDLEISLLKASAHPHRATHHHRSLTKRIVLSGLLGTSALVVACSSPVGNKPIGDDVAGTSPSHNTSSQTYMASLPSTGQNWYRPAMAASLRWPGNIEVVRLSDICLLEHLYWEPGQSSWVRTAIFGYNPAGTGAGTASSDPGLCIFAPDSNMQVVVNQSSGILLHYWRDNTNMTWTRTTEFSQNCVGAPALINNRQISTNLEVVVREGTHLKHIWRDGNYVWQNETQFATAQTVVDDPSLVQAADGRLHVIAVIQSGSQYSMGHWIRDLQYVWSYFGSFANGIVWQNRGGGALAANYLNNTLEAVIPLMISTSDYPTELYRFDGTQWSDDGHLCNDAYTGSALMYPAATTLAGSELHVEFFNMNFCRKEHWKIIQ
jgi:hypothetical protein